MTDYLLRVKSTIQGIPSILSPRRDEDEIQINNRGIICTAACILKHRGGGPDKFVSLTSFQGGEIPFHPTVWPRLETKLEARKQSTSESSKSPHRNPIRLKDGEL